MKIITIITLLFSIMLMSCSSEPSFEVISSNVPDLTMLENGLTFKEIEDYKNYRIVATHFRKDKNELRYVLANDKAFAAFKQGGLFPNGSRIVKIGWSTESMSNFAVAVEAKTVQRIEYMIKDSNRFNNNPGNWGYARFVKNSGKYESWTKGTASCISCHNLAKNNDFVFTKFQKLQ